ncbi:hypothetical protein Tco_0547687 [Tanacetum coccineum]
MASSRMARFVSEVAPPQFVSLMRHRRTKMLDTISEDEREFSMIESSSLAYSAPSHQATRPMNGGAMEAANVGLHGYQVTPSNRNPMAFVHQPPHVGPHNLPHQPTPSMPQMQASHNMDFHPQLVFTSRRLPSNSAIVPFQSGMKQEPRFVTDSSHKAQHGAPGKVKEEISSAPTKVTPTLGRSDELAISRKNGGLWVGQRSKMLGAGCCKRSFWLLWVVQCGAFLYKFFKDDAPSLATIDRPVGKKKDNGLWVGRKKDNGLWVGLKKDIGLWVDDQLWFCLGGGGWRIWIDDGDS